MWRASVNGILAMWAEAALRAEDFEPVRPTAETAEQVNRERLHTIHSAAAARLRSSLASSSELTGNPSPRIANLSE